MTKEAKKKVAEFTKLDETKDKLTARLAALKLERDRGIEIQSVLQRKLNETTSDVNRITGAIQILEELIGDAPQ